MSSLLGDIGLGVSASQSVSQQPVGFQEAGTYINFGSGWISTPQDNQINPSSSATATASASPTVGRGAVGGDTAIASGSAATLTKYLPWIAVGVAGLIAVGAIIYAVKKK